MKKRFLCILLCLVMAVGLLPTTAFAWSDEANECWYCNAIYYGDVDEQIYATCCGVCGPDANDCYIETHCLRCGGCYAGDVMFWCDVCGMCKNCQEDNPETHCADCGDCYLGIEDDLCGECHRCDLCAIICPECGFCDECANNASDPMHCTVCGECFESAGLADHPNALHCPDCCLVCEQCWGEDTCITDDPDKEYCDECGLCMDCCMENRNGASGCDEYCIESSEWEEHYCEACGECWCEHEKCELCGLCEDCCEANSDCSDSMCVEDGEYEDHFCENCGACAHEFESTCETCGYCDQCCLDARLIYGCDCDADQNVCFEDTDFEEHLAAEHPEAEPGEHPCTPKALWSIDENNHWKSCRFCDEAEHFTGKEAHKYNVDGKCVVCGYQQGRRVYFTRQPENAKAKVGDPNDYYGMGGSEGITHPLKNSVYFRVSARGEGELTYQWFRLDPSAEDPYSSAIALENGYENRDAKTWFFYEGADTNRLTVYVSELGCDPDFSEEMLYFCMVYDKVEGKPVQSAQSETARLTVGHRYSNCSSQVIAGTNRSMYGPSEMYDFRQIASVWETDGHNWECCGEECDELKNRVNTPHSYQLVGSVEGTFSEAEARKGIFRTYYKYKCIFCRHVEYVEKHAHDFQAPGDPTQINQLLADGKYTNAVHPLVCTVDGCEELSSELHEWTFDVVAYPTDTKPGALHRVCRICDYWIDGEWYPWNPTVGHGATTYWDRTNMIVEAFGGSANRTLLFPNESLTIVPKPEEGEKVVGWTAKYTDYSQKDEHGNAKVVDVTAKLTMTWSETTGKWTVSVPSFEAMGVTGGGRLTLTAVTVPCEHTRTALVDVREAICIHEGYTGDLACQDCGFILTYGTKITAEATEHSGLTLVEGTQKTGSCTEYGYEGDYVCGVCGDTVRGKRLSKVHGATYLDDYVEPNCTTEGYTGDERCTRCDGMVKRGKILPVQHGETVLKDQKLDACVGSGYSGNQVCKDCGTVVEYGYATPALGHDWDDGKVVTISGYRGGTFKRYTCQRCGEQNDVRVLRTGGVDDKVIKSANFELSGFALGSTKADITLTPDEATAAAMNIRYDICKQSPVLAGALRDDYVPTLQAGEQIEAGQSYWLRVIMLKRNDYTYAEKAFASLNGTKVASFFGDSTITLEMGRDKTKVPVKVAVFKLDSIPAYTVTVSGSTAETTGAGKYGKGETVTIDAGTKPGYTFAGWTGSDGVTFADAASATTTFTMPGSSVTVTANWKVSDVSIPSVDFTLDGYELGKKIADIRVTPDAATNAMLTYNNAYWSGSYVICADASVLGGSFSSAMRAESGETLQAHTPYYLVVTLAVKEGYSLADLTKDHVTLNGMTASVLLPGKNASQCCHVVFTLSQLTGGSSAPKFPDVVPGSYYENAVDWAAENGVISGTPGGMFDPEGLCNRAQAVTFLWRAAGSPAPKGSTMTFPDVPKGSYYYDAVLWAAENGITFGTGDGTVFSPDMECTRAQIVTLLWRAVGSPAPKDKNVTFPDVSKGSYYADAVLWAVENGITNGTGDGTKFSPDMECNCAQIITFIYRCMK